MAAGTMVLVGGLYLAFSLLYAWVAARQAGSLQKGAFCLVFCLALGIGTVICGVMLSLWKKPVTERDEEFDELSDQKLKDEEITFTLE